MDPLLKPIASITALAATLAMATFAHAEKGESDGDMPVKRVIAMPLIPGWYKGRQIAYLQTEASDPAVAAAQRANYVPKLANVLQAQAVSYDDIYTVTNFKQSNVVPSAPIPAGPNNTDPNYSPLWQLSKVTWADPSKAHTLKSEEEILAAEAAKLVTIVKTQIIVNCSIISSPQGGTLPGAELESEHH